MKGKNIAKITVILLAFVMLFSLCTFTVAAAKGNVTETAQPAKKAARKTYTQALIDVEKRLPPESKGFWRDGIMELKKVESYDKAIAGAVGNIFEIISDKKNADWTEIGMETLKSAVNILASCYGLGGVTDAIFDGLMNYGDNPQSEIQILQGHLDTQFEELHNHWKNLGN